MVKQALKLLTGRNTMMMQESEISNVPEEEAAAEQQSETQVLHLSGEHRGSARQQRADQSTKVGGEHLRP